MRKINGNLQLMQNSCKAAPQKPKTGNAAKAHEYFKHIKTVQDKI